MELPKQIKDEIWEYCRVNNISNVDEFTIKMVQQGFTSEKFGATPWDKPAEIIEKEVEKIVEKEVIKEVPVEVEKIVEKEVIKEVPVEVIKEVEVIREIKVTDNDETNKLLSELESVKNDERIHKKSVYDLAKERKTLKEVIKELEVNIEEMENDLLQLNKTLDIVQKENGDRGKTILELSQKIEQLEAELEAERAKPKKEKNKDIYGEGKEGFFGSNISDIWNRKKK